MTKEDYALLVGAQLEGRLRRANYAVGVWRFKWRFKVLLNVPDYWAWIGLSDDETALYVIRTAELNDK